MQRKTRQVYLKLLKITFIALISERKNETLQ